MRLRFWAFLCLFFASLGVFGGLLASPALFPVDAAPPAGAAVPGDTTTCFVVFPADCNANPPMAFGGKMMAEMDRCAAVTVRRFLYGSPAGARDAVTVSVDRLTFHHPAEVKDLVVVSGRVVKAGEKSVTVAVAAGRERPGEFRLLTDAEFTFVAYDLERKRAVPHGLRLAPR